MARDTLRAEIAVGLPQDTAHGAGDAAGAAYAAFQRIGASIGAWGDEAARIEGERAGKIAGQSPDFASTGATTIRGRAYDKAGEASFLALTQANFTSDALTLAADPSLRDNPTALGARYAQLTDSYKQRVGQAGQHLVGDFTVSATELGTKLRMRALDAMEAKQKDSARARFFETQQTHATNVARLAASDPDSEATFRQAQEGLAGQFAALDAGVAAGHFSAEEAAKKKQALQSDTLVTIYSARAGKMTDPQAIETLRGKLGDEFKAGKSRLDGATWERLDADLRKLSKTRAAEYSVATATLRKEFDDYVDRAAKALTPPRAEWDALETKAKALGPAGGALLSEARGKLQVETAMRGMNAQERADYLAKLEDQAKQGLPQDGATMTRDNWTLGFYKPEDLLAPTDGGQKIDARAATMADRAAQRFFDETGVRVRVNDPDTGQAGTAGRRRGVADPADNPHVANSQHLHGKAFDFQTQGLNEAQKARFLTILREEGFGGIGIYKGGAGHTHADAGPARVWDDGGGIPGWAAEALKTPARPQGVTAPMARTVEHGRETDKRITRLEKDDLLGAAEQAGVMPGGTARPLDMTSGDGLAASVAARTAQATAVAGLYKRATPTIFRPEEKKAIGETLQAGGQKALDTINGIVRGAGAQAPAALAELGESAPEMAHASMLAVQTGDTGLQRRVAAALEARRVPGAKPLRVTGDTIEQALKDEAGSALQGLSLAQRERVKATIALAYEHLAAQRGLNPDDVNATKELARQALGASKVGGVSYGGVANVYARGNWGGTWVKTLAPPDVRADRFSDALHALTDDDLKGLADPPVDAKGKPMSAADLLKRPPTLTAGGAYVFGHADATTGAIEPVRAQSGKPFALPWAGVAEALRKRVPEAFR